MGFWQPPPSISRRDDIFWLTAAVTLLDHRRHTVRGWIPDTRPACVVVGCLIPASRRRLVGRQVLDVCEEHHASWAGAPQLPLPPV